MYKHFVKRLIGFFGALCGIILLSPIFIVVAIWLYFANKGAGVFFFQERIGKGERPFNIIKFKSMTDECDAEGNLLPDAERLTAVGRFVRSTSIDELPQFFNILKGDMAFIGPRPLPKVYLPYYTEEESKRHDVLPGISGWAQVNGRKDITWERKLALDVYYAEHCSFQLDVKIFFLTIYKVFKRESVDVESSGIVSLYDIRGIQREKYAQYAQK